MPEPLKRRREEDGTLYERPPEIEDWLSRLELSDVEERLQQFAISSKKNPAYVPTEALIYFLRQAWTASMAEEFEKLFQILMKRLASSLFVSVPNSGITDAQTIREEIMAEFATRIAEDCKGQVSVLDFYEIRFDKAFAAFRTSMLRKIGPSTVDTVPLNRGNDDYWEISPEVEAAAEVFLNGDPQKIDDPAFRLELGTAIDQLPDDQKQVIGLKLKGFQISSTDRDAMTIASILKCDERTVRNRLNRAYKILRVILQEENV
jgi:DNA-binding CsgD family transcriptional regulator